MPGRAGGYFWAPCVSDDFRKHVAAINGRMGRCFFYLRSLIQRKGIAMAAVQTVFDWVERPTDSKQNDDLAALVAAEGITMTDVFESMVTRLGETEEGKKVLQTVGTKHAELLVPRDVLDDALAAVDGARMSLLAIRQAG